MQEQNIIQIQKSLMTVAGKLATSGMDTYNKYTEANTYSERKVHHNFYLLGKMERSAYHHALKVEFLKQTAPLVEKKPSYAF